MKIKNDISNSYLDKVVRIIIINVLIMMAIMGITRTLINIIRNSNNDYKITTIILMMILTLLAVGLRK